MVMREKYKSINKPLKKKISGRKGPKINPTVKSKRQKTFYFMRQQCTY